MEFKFYLFVIFKVVDIIFDQDVFFYFIFIVYQMDVVDIGIVLLSYEVEDGFVWLVYVSIFEELAIKKVIEMNKVDNFWEVYKDLRENFCFFVFSDLGVNFMFIFC